jgi:hypothetical protein
VKFIVMKTMNWNESEMNDLWSTQCNSIGYEITISVIVFILN